MRILAIETSCDETALSIVDVKKEGKKTKFKILGNEISSQIEIHAQYGGVFPMMAKREHGKNILNILFKVLKESKMYSLNKKAQPNKKLENKVEFYPSTYKRGLYKSINYYFVYFTPKSPRGDF